jgi:hypothetical protein
MDNNINDKIISVDTKLNNLDIKLNNLDIKLNKILDLLENNVSKNCEKMENHINFVESVYDNVKHPLQFVCNNFKYLTNNDYDGYDNEDLTLK